MMRKIKGTMTFKEREACPTCHSINLSKRKRGYLCRVCRDVFDIAETRKLLHNDSGKCIEMISEITVFESKSLT